MNGAGLINALYLRPGAVAVQLVPFGRRVNFDEFGLILRARGPYLEWHNTLERNSRLPRGENPANSDTTVDAGDFEALVRQAVTLGLHRDMAAVVAALHAESRGYAEAPPRVASEHPPPAAPARTAAARPSATCLVE